MALSINACISRGETYTWRTELYLVKRRHREDEPCSNNHRLPPEPISERQLR